MTAREVTTLGVYSDGEIRERLGSLRDAGKIGARHATPPPKLVAGSRSPVQIPRPSPIPREIVEANAVASIETEPPPAPRFPRAEVMLAALAIADLCRVAASSLEAIAANAAEYEPSTLRRHSHGIVRALFAELEGRVAL